MTAETKVYRVAASFFGDHQTRDLFIGRVVRTMARTVDVELDAEGFEALRSDAVFYAEEMRDPENVDAETAATSRSAERVVKALDKVGPPAPLPPAEAASREQARQAQDDADKAAHDRFLEQLERDRAARDRAKKEQREREDQIDWRLLLRIENSGKAIDGIEPADASRILNERGKDPKTNWR